MSGKEIIAFNSNIYPVFVKYAECMKKQKNLDISKYKTVKSKASAILDLISIIPPSDVQRMPPDEYLGNEFVETFNQWIQGGCIERKITFDDDIYPVFVNYAGCMVKQKNLNISVYKTVKSSASVILDMISIIPPSDVQRMPPDEYLGDEFVETFNKWIQYGYIEKIITFDDDIYPVFVKYAGCMIKQKNLDISKYKTVKSNASTILNMISIIPPSTVQRMPPDEYLGDGFVETFNKWIQDGCIEKKITFNDDIYPVFVKYADCMIKQKNLDISKYKTVKSNASTILDMISIIPPSTVQRMPPDEYLGDEFVETFNQWILGGCVEKKKSKI